MKKFSRQEIWKHNGLLGGAEMIKACARRMVNASTTTNESRALATEVFNKVEALRLSLKTRRDQEGPSS